MLGKIKTIEKKIDQLQRVQKKRIGSKLFSDLIEIEQINWCRGNRELANLSFEAFQFYKHEGNAEKAIYYFEIAYKFHCKKIKLEIPKPNNKEEEDPDFYKDPNEAYVHALSYLFGIGKKASLKRGLELLKYAAKKKHKMALFHLGTLSLSADELQLDLDKKKGITYIKESADLDNPIALNRLGGIYNIGEEVKQDLKKGRECYGLAARRGDAIAQYNYGYLFAQGKDINQDYKKAFFWYIRSAEQGFSIAQYTIGLLYHNGKVIEKDSQKALYWLKEAAMQDHYDAQLQLGSMYSSGKGVKKNKGKAKKWFKKAAALNNARAQYQLAVMYKYDTGKGKNLKKAAIYFEKAAEQGHMLAQFEIAEMYYSGKGVFKNGRKAYYWHKQSAEQGYAPAQVNLGLDYYQGIGITADINKTIHWLKSATKQEDPIGHYYLGNLYSIGEGFSQSMLYAARHYHIAAEKKHLASIGKLQPQEKINALSIHYALFRYNIRKAAHLIRRHPSLIHEVSWDIKRKFGDEGEQEKILWFTYKLLKNLIHYKEHSNKPYSKLQNRVFLSINKLTLTYLTYLLKYNKEGSQSEKLDVFEKSKFLLKQVDIKAIKPSGTGEMLSFLIRIWQMSADFQAIEQHNNFTQIISQKIESILFYLKSLEIELDEPHHLYNALLIAIKNRYGSDFEIGISNPNFDLILQFLLLYKRNPNLSYKKMNEQLDCHLIRTTYSINYVGLLNQLTTFLENFKLAENAPSLVYLHSFLRKTWLKSSNQNVSEARNLLLQLNKKLKNESLKSLINSDLFFTVKNPKAIFIFKCLANEDYKALILFLEEQNLKKVDEKTSDSEQNERYGSMVPD